MKLPFVLLDNLDKDTQSRWQKQFVIPGRSTIDGIWRRTQCFENKDKSGWKSKNDMRRKMVHYFDTFDVFKRKKDYIFTLTEPFLWVHYTFPKEEIKHFDILVEQSLKKWNQLSKNTYTCGDLVLNIDSNKPEKDFMEFPDNYLYRSYTLSRQGYSIPTNVKDEPWDVLKTGIRPIKKRGNPKKISNLSEIKKYFPAHFELGCGPSIEAGIPPLHFLHDVFYISNPKTSKFILDLDKDNLIPNILSNPELFYLKSSIPYQKALTAPVTKFYRMLKTFKDKKLLLEPIISNNFDGLPSFLGLKEKYVRQYKESKIIPKINFNSKAKSFIVIGSHADRRRTQESARKAGLKVVYIDPEKFSNDHPYPLESPQDEDILINMTAQQFADALQKIL